MDCDIYGPSVPLMLGLTGRPEIEGDGPNAQILPLERHGVKVMSMGFLVDDNTPVVWRGPMIMKTIQQFVQNVKWGEIDVLLVDLPPGTGDAQLSLVQTLPLTGAVLVTTPQVAAATYDLYTKQQVIAREATLFEDGIKANFDALIAMGDLTAPPPLAGFIDGSYLAEASKP